MYDWSGCRVWATLKNAFSQWTLCKCFKAQACAMCFANVATSQVIFTWPVAGLLLSVTFIIIRAQAVLQCHVTYLLSFWPDITLSVYELVRREEHHAVESSRTDWRSKLCVSLPRPWQKPFVHCQRVSIQTASLCLFFFFGLIILTCLSQNLQSN